MKRLCLILAFLFLFTQTASAMPLLIGQKVVYRGTITGLRISAVDGTAFIDNLPYTYQSDFSAGVDGWTQYGGTNAGNIDSIGGEDNWLRQTLSTANDAHAMIRSAFLTVGKKYTISFKYYVPSGQTVVAGIKLVNAAGTTITGVTYQNTLDTVTTYTVDFVSPSTGIQIRATNAAGGNDLIQDPGGDDVFYIKDITISEIQPYMDGNHQIEIYDASNRMLRGVLKAAGEETGETLGGDVLAGWDFTSGWTPKATTTINDNNTFTAGDTSGYVTKTMTISGKLMKSSIDGSVTIGTLLIVDGYSSLIANSSTPIYRTATFNNISVYNGFTSAGSITDIISMTSQQVLTPSALGATIVSAKGGTTYNFSYRNPDFGFNLLSYYVIIRAIR